MKPQRPPGTDLEGVTQERSLELARERWAGFGPWAEKCANPRAPYQVRITVTEHGAAKRKRLGCGLTWARVFLSADLREQIAHVLRRSRITGKRAKAEPLEQVDLFAAQGCAHAMDRG